MTVVGDPIVIVALCPDVNVVVVLAPVPIVWIFCKSVVAEVCFVVKSVSIGVSWLVRLLFMFVTFVCASTNRPCNVYT